MQDILFRFKIGENEGSWSTIKNLKQALTEIKQISQLQEKDIDKEKTTELKELQKELQSETSIIEFAKKEHLAIYKLKDFLDEKETNTTIDNLIKAIKNITKGANK